MMKCDPFRNFVQAGSANEKVRLHGVGPDDVRLAGFDGLLQFGNDRGIESPLFGNNVERKAFGADRAGEIIFFSAKKSEDGEFGARVCARLAGFAMELKNGLGGPGYGMSLKDRKNPKWGGIQLSM